MRSRIVKSPSCDEKTEDESHESDAIMKQSAFLTFFIIIHQFKDIPTI